MTESPSRTSPAQHSPTLTEVANLNSLTPADYFTTLRRLTSDPDVLAAADRAEAVAPVSDSRPWHCDPMWAIGAALMAAPVCQTLPLAAMAATWLAFTLLGIVALLIVASVTISVRAWRWRS